MNRTEIDIEALFEQAFDSASSGENLLTAEQKAQVAGLLADTQHPTNTILAIRTLGYAYATEYKELIAQYLDGHYAYIALYVFSEYWGAEREYLPQIRRLMRRTPEDIYGETQKLALEIAARCLDGEISLELTNDLMTMYQDQSEQENIKVYVGKMLRYALDNAILPVGTAEKIKGLVANQGD